MKSHNAPLSQTAPDSILRDAELLGDLSKPDPLLTETDRGFDAPRRNEMLSSVFGVADQSQVGDTIIKAVPVDVVDVFAWQEFPPDGLFHNQSMFVDLLPVNSASPIAIRGDVAPSLIRVMAGETTKHTGANTRGTARYFSTAIQAFRIEHVERPTGLGQYSQARKYGLAGLMAGGGAAAATQQPNALQQQ